MAHRSSPHYRPAAGWAEAAERLAGEQTHPVADLAGFPLVMCGNREHPTAPVLLRWGCLGRRVGSVRVYLDLKWCNNRLTWVTSREAGARFVAAVNTAAAGAAKPTTTH